MARIRTIKPEFWTDSLMVQLPHFVRLLYIGLWNCADDYGYFRDEPDRIAMELFPRETVADVDEAIQLLAAAGRLESYVHESGFAFYRVASWENHQRVDKPSKSKVFREGSRRFAIPTGVRREVATKYGCAPGETVPAECYYCGAPGSVVWFRLSNGRPSGWVVFPDLELDHLECVDAGGENSSGNIVLACRRCNRSKGTEHWFSYFASRIFPVPPGIHGNPREGSRVLALEGKGTEGNREGNGTEGTLARGSAEGGTEGLSDFALDQLIGDGTDRRAVQDWIEHRQRKGKPLRPHEIIALGKILAGLGDATVQQRTVMHCIASGWMNIRQADAAKGAAAPVRTWTPTEGGGDESAG